MSFDRMLIGHLDRGLMRETYLADLQVGLQALQHMPDEPDEQRKVIELKRHIVETLVEKVSVDRNHQFTVTIRLHLLVLY